MTEFEEVQECILKSKHKPQLSDAVKLCKIKKITDPNELFELFEYLLHEWTDRRSYTKTWSD